MKDIQNGNFSCFDFTAHLYEVVQQEGGRRCICFSDLLRLKFCEAERKSRCNAFYKKCVVIICAYEFGINLFLINSELPHHPHLLISLSRCTTALCSTAPTACVPPRRIYTHRKDKQTFLRCSLFWRCV